ncbi:hypothetical protein CEY12_09090 [Chryseobacterium sp. T16E-39]|uniref:DUF3108 domain-containing protein n=1 Tax=Chryseobacterium sp. T16E-39 TaxID=2015076 RepID=UPI000B5B20AE|nr:hypothetical protein [Chryseobacterium sp. T16E-39]ASK30260.1 hypothetical protein CEY12_09090 [Chryseobacterium sp. T16E-39]
MKSILIFCSILITTLSASFLHAQNKVQTPEKNEIITDLIKNEKEKMIWYALIKDTSRVEIAKIFTDINRYDKSFSVKTTVKMTGKPDWIDETTAELPQLKPIKHSSFNTNRDMVLNFGKTVTGYYTDKATNTKTDINEKVEGSFFDSNLYPQIIRWLPLKEGYKTDIAIFDYNPKASGVMKAHITNTQKGTFKNKEVWIVSVTDDISNNAVKMAFYIDTKSNQVLKQEMDAGGRKMIIERIE